MGAGGGRGNENIAWLLRCTMKIPDKVIIHDLKI